MKIGFSRGIFNKTNDVTTKRGSVNVYARDSQNSTGTCQGTCDLSLLPQIYSSAYTDIYCRVSDTVERCTGRLMCKYSDAAEPEIFASYSAGPNDGQPRLAICAWLLGYLAKTCKPLFTHNSVYQVIVTPYTLIGSRNYINIIILLIEVSYSVTLHVLYRCTAFNYRELLFLRLGSEPKQLIKSHTRKYTCQRELQLYSYVASYLFNFQIGSLQLYIYSRFVIAWT